MAVDKKIRYKDRRLTPTEKKKIKPANQGGGKNYLGNLITRFGALNIVIIMLFALGLAHRDWLITPKLFMSEQIFLLLIGLYFLIRGNK